MIGRSMDGGSLEHTLLPSRHAEMRMSARRISPQALELTVRFGRRVHVRHGTMHVIGKRELSDPKLPTEVRDLEGVHVLCAPDGRIITAFRNRSLAGLRAAVRRRRRRRLSRRTLTRRRRRRR